MKKFKLLVVDDEADFAEFVADVSEGMGFDVSISDDPTEFTSLYNADLNVIVLDLFMPNIDGIEILRFLSECRSHASIIFMSGKDEGVLHSAQEIAIEQGMSVLGVLAKPFHIEQLEEVLSKYVENESLQPVGFHIDPSVTDIAMAIKNNELFMVYQPQINMENREVIGVEALIRWNHSSRGLVPPDIFIPIAEQNNLMKDISSFVTNTTIKQQAEWLKSGVNLRMSINISPKNLDDLLLPEKLAATVNKEGADINSIMIEVTETSLMTDIIRYMDILTRLKMKGFKLSIDDFGTGYSSLQQLVRAPFDELKVDQAFIKNIDSDKDCKTIAEISILLALKLGMKVVAEGIENEIVWETLKELGCHEGQGYWMSKPMLPGEILAWKENWDSTMSLNTV